MSRNSDSCFSSSKQHFLHRILNPSSIAVFGANNNFLTTMGSMQLRNVIAGGFEGEIYPIHPKLGRVQGYKAYENVLDLPETPDLAFIILPPEIVPEVLEECGQKGIKGAIITSGGFREVGKEGKKLSEKLTEIAKKYGIRFIGPNCLGVFNNWYQPNKLDSHFNTMWIYQIPNRGKISIASQSGTIACHTFWHAKDWGIKIGKSLSIGNELNIDLVDFLQYFKDDPQTKVIGLYIEEIKRGREFIKIIKDITSKKPVIAIYAGGSEAAERSIKSHTGAIGGNQKIYDGLFRETGIISTNSITDFLYYLRTFDFAQKFGVYPKGDKVGIITDSGGSGSMMVKSAENIGLKVPEFSEELQKEIRELIPPTAASLNPIDVTFDIDFVNMFIKFPKILAKSGEVDSIIIYGVFDLDDVMKTMESSGMEFDEHMKQIGDIIEGAVMKPVKRLMQKYSIPIFYVGPYSYKYIWYQKFIKQDLPIFDFWDQPTKCVKVLRKYQGFKEKSG
jgi:acyl-CoA synthetase (NDP forming)